MNDLNDNDLHIILKALLKTNSMVKTKDHLAHLKPALILILNRIIYIYGRLQKPMHDFIKI